MGDISHPSYHLPKTNQNLRNDVLFVKLEEVDQIIYIVICASGNQDSVQLKLTQLTSELTKIDCTVQTQKVWKIQAAIQSCCFK